VPTGEGCGSLRVVRLPQELERPGGSATDATLLD
jgi:hypothetical protein